MYNVADLFSMEHVQYIMYLLLFAKDKYTVSNGIYMLQ